MTEAVNLVTLPRINPRHQVRTTAPDGTSIATMVAMALPSAKPESADVLTMIDGHIILPEKRRLVRPRAGTTVVIRVIPRGDNAALRNVLMIAVTVAALAVGQFWLGPAAATAILGEGASGFAAGFITSATTAGLTAGAPLAVNVSIPTPERIP